MANLATVCLFTYNRLDKTKKTINALQKNYLSKDTHLVVFSDGPKNIQSKEEIEKVRCFLKNIDGFKSVKIHESPTNQGLAQSIIKGVTKVISLDQKVIVLEDDLISSQNFLNFMNQALDFYCLEKKFFSISGYTMDLKSLNNHAPDYYFGRRGSSWGWATWNDRWENIDWDVKDYKKYKWNLKKILQFSKGGSDMPFMLRKQMKNRIDSWAIRWCYHQFKYDLLTVFPSKSKILNIGFGKKATHTKKLTRFETNLDNGIQKSFTFEKKIVQNTKLEKEFRGKFSFFKRLKDKLI